MVKYVYSLDGRTFCYDSCKDTVEEAIEEARKNACKGKRIVFIAEGLFSHPSLETDSLIEQLQFYVCNEGGNFNVNIEAKEELYRKINDTFLEWLQKYHYQFPITCTTNTKIYDLTNGQLLEVCNE